MAQTDRLKFLIIEAVKRCKDIPLLELILRLLLSKGG